MPAYRLLRVRSAEPYSPDRNLAPAFGVLEIYAGDVRPGDADDVGFS